jgi:D-alanyl-lipoteichoic acid acyltransferase DltB (MBOAT superfamily)
MLFNSLVFLIFAAIFYAGWSGLARRSPHLKQAFLISASLIFYGWWSVSYIGLIIASGLIDYASGLGMKRSPHRKRIFLACSLVGNLGLLGAFKYAHFLTHNLDLLLAHFGVSFGFEAALPATFDALPVGISFYTFQSMSYTIDVYRGRLQPTRNLLAFFAYLSLFPQLVAGPIVRAAQLLPEVLDPKPASSNQLDEGLRLIVYGLAKKIILADQLAPYVDAAFANGNTSGSAGYWWFVAALFAAQIYGDFSGYTDIARGLGKWMGFDFGINFNHPYIATSLRDFWTRWHISLSSWFRDYVYIPLGGSRRGVAWGLGAMATTMLISGLWHGAAWTFVAWGALHAGFLAFERVTGLAQRIGPRFGRALTLAVVLIAWVMFRAQSIDQAGTIIGVMTGLVPSEPSSLAASTFSLIPIALIALFALRELAAVFGLGWHQLSPTAQRRWQPIALAAIACAAITLRGPAAQFIYFQF